ncbi:MAG: VOC family protein [Gammaproteobacteria bacterium]|nr:VOC family protein [Gammaproteobacteria bacterium]
MPNLYRVILPVTDIDAAEAFYAQILEMPGKRVSLS